MICKYCHEKNHLIDNCPNIICKKCNKQGHPQWLCNEKKYKNKFIDNSKIDNKFNNKFKFSTNNIDNKSFFDRNNYDKNNYDKNIIKEEKNLSYYLNLENKNWGNIMYDE